MFELEQQQGSLVGFWSPPYMGTALTVPGFHLHFLSADKERGGHVLDAKLLQGTAYIQPVSRLAGQCSLFCPTPNCHACLLAPFPPSPYFEGARRTGENP